jgi:hypothetical protein
LGAAKKELADLYRLGRRIGLGMREGISAQAIDHISLIKIAGNQNIMGMALISFAGSTSEERQGSRLGSASGADYHASAV